MKILVMKFRNIGDVLLMTPLLTNLKHHYAGATIHVAVNRGAEAMVSGHSAVDTVVVYDRDKIKGESFWKRLKLEWKFARNIRRQRYDMIINTTEGDRGAQLALLSGASIRVGYRPRKNKLLQRAFTHTLPDQGLRHTIETNLDVLRVLGLPLVSKKVRLHFSNADHDAVTTLLQAHGVSDFVHVHPVSRWQFKCIADKTMAAVIDFIQEGLQRTVVLTAAPEVQEQKKIEAILQCCRSSPVNLAGQLTLKQTAALNKLAVAFVGVDTAVMHISAANDVPVLAFFGPSGADHWGPWDNDVADSSDQESLSGYPGRRGFRQMGKHRVIQESWPCVPCGRDGCDGSKISDCLMRLDIAFIKKNLSEMLHNA